MTGKMFSVCTFKLPFMLSYVFFVLHYYGIHISFCPLFNNYATMTLCHFVSMAALAITFFARIRL